MENIAAPLTQQNTSVVAFRLDQRTFALPLDVIVQILPMMTITPIPHMSRIVKGTINIRGEDVLVISLRSHFGIEEIELQLYTPLLLLKLNNRLLVLIVDAVLDVMSLPLEKLTSLQNILPEGIEDIPMMRGVSYYKDETILVLDPEHLFYNHHPLAQLPDELKTGATSDTPSAMRMLIEDALIPPSADRPAVKRTPVAKRKPAAKSTPVVESVPVVEDALIVESAPAVEDAPVVESAPVEENTPLALPPENDAPVEDEQI
jgi:purine-binding chemotaxis protein CheW